MFDVLMAKLLVLLPPSGPFPAAFGATADDVGVVLSDCWSQLPVLLKVFSHWYDASGMLLHPRKVQMVPVVAFYSI